MSSTHQFSILASPPLYGRSLSFDLCFAADPAPALARLVRSFDPAAGVVGLGDPLARALKRDIAGLRVFPAIPSADYALPSAQHALWAFMRGDNRGEVFDRARLVMSTLDEAFDLVDAVDTFDYAGGHDLTGYHDGAANPDGEDAVSVAIGPKGESFVAVQRWEHDLDRFHSHTPDEKDAMIGRRLSDNEEIDDAPASAHVKRTAQETYRPTAFMVRRSHPWAVDGRQGLEFIAYGATLDAFETVLRQMAGLSDGVRDALFTFSRPVNGGYYWCPPLKDGRLDLAAVGV